MNKTDTVREWYHAGIVLNHADRGEPGYQPECNHATAPKASIPREGGGFYLEPVHPLTVEAWNAYTTVMKAMGVTITGEGGIDNCRNIGDGDWPSLHAYLLALDNPPNDRMPQAFIEAIEKIRTKNGAQVFRNLGYIGDRMHNEVNCSPDDLATGIDWTTVEGGDEMAFADFVEDIQNDLNTLGYTDKAGNPLTPDGKWGAKTRQAFREMMRAAKQPGEKGDTGPAGPAGVVNVKVNGKTVFPG